MTALPITSMQVLNVHRVVDRHADTSRRATPEWLGVIKGAVMAGMVICGMVMAPAGIAYADSEQAVPGTPVIRGDQPGMVVAGPSEVRSAKSGVPLAGAPQNFNGGGLISNGNAASPGGVGASTLCGSDAMNKGHQGAGSKVIDCGSDFIPYN